MGNICQIDSFDDGESEYYQLRNIFGSIEKEEMKKITEELEGEARGIAHSLFKRMI